VLNIVVLDGHTLNPGDNPWDDLANLGNLTVFDRSVSGEVIARTRSADVAIVNKVRLGTPEFQQLPQLRFVSVTATGFDCVDAIAAAERGIAVSNVPVYGTDSVAQYVVAMLLHILHRIDLHDQAIRDGCWSKAGDFSFWKVPLVELVGMRIGIVGFGRIGRRVGQLANALGMQVAAASPRHIDTPTYDPFHWVDLDDIARHSDVITLHCPLTQQTRGLINRRFLEKCRPSAIFVNASRGPLVVEQDLADALNSGQIAAAGLDVVSDEPIPPDNPLLKAKNCFLTPHLAWATLAARRRLMKTTVENVRRFIAGRPQNVVNGVGGIAAR
jgi:glycerate dehydrogenase